MKLFKSSRSSSARRNLTLIACGFALSLLPLQSLQAADAAAPKANADVHAAALPLKATYKKVPGAKGAPLAADIHNDSKKDLKLKAKVLLSVVSHNLDKARHLPEHTLAAGKTWTIDELAGDDKIIIEAEGYAPLELSVPFVK